MLVTIRFHPSYEGSPGKNRRFDHHVATVCPNHSIIWQHATGPACNLAGLLHAVERMCRAMQRWALVRPRTLAKGVWKNAHVIIGVPSVTNLATF